MKIWSDFATLVKVIVVCLAVGFTLGLCLAGAAFDPDEGRPTPPSLAMASVPVA